MRRRAEKQFQRATAYHGLGATGPSESPLPPSLLGVSLGFAPGLQRVELPVAMSRSRMSVCGGKAGTLTPSNPSERFEGEPGRIRE